MRTLIFGIAVAWTLNLIVYGAQGASGQDSAPDESVRIIPAPPVEHDTITDPSGAQTAVTHQAKQDATDPERAYDSVTGQKLVWDRTKKTWRDAKTRKAIGFEGRLTKDGAVIPAPPLHGASSPDTQTIGTHQAKQLPDDPERAYDIATQQTLVWDRKNKTWVDAKSGEAVGFHGRRVAVSVTQKPAEKSRPLPGGPMPEPKAATSAVGPASNSPSGGAVSETSSSSGSVVTQGSAPELRVIPAPPLSDQGTGTVIESVQDLDNPDRAYDPRTEQMVLMFNRDRKSWIDTRTGQAIGFQGALAKDGTIIPAPPVISGRTGGKHQAQQDKIEPERAYDSVTGQTLVWDRNQNTWIDTKTQAPVGFQGAFVSGSTVSGGSSGGSGEGPRPLLPGFGFGFGFGGSSRW